MIPQGIFLLTNKRVFFLHKKEELKETGEKYDSYLDAAFSGAKEGTKKGMKKGLLSGLSFGLADVGKGIKDVQDARTKKINEIDFEPFIESELSFAFPSENIESYEKFGSIFGLRPRNSYLRIVITEKEGLTTDYCMYGNVPGKPFTKIMDQGKWVKAFKNNGI